MLTPGQYTHHPKCPHLIATLQRVLDEVALPMWMPGQCSGTTPILVRGPSGPRSATGAAPAPRVKVYTTLYGAVAQVAVPPTVYEMVQALGYHHLGDLYTENRQVLPERALKRRAPARKGIPGLRAWLACHAAVLVPLLGNPRRDGKRYRRTGSRGPCPPIRRKSEWGAGQPKTPEWRRYTIEGSPSG